MVESASSSEDGRNGEGSKSFGRGMFRQPREGNGGNNINGSALRTQSRFRGHSWNGSPWDEATPRSLKIEDLTDLDKSFVDEDALQKKRKRAEEEEAESYLQIPRAKRWKYTGDAKDGCINVDDLPPGWSTEEPDLDPNDYNAQITRCEERMEDGLMLHYFRWKGHGLVHIRNHYIELRTKYGKELDWDVILRLETLVSIEASLVKSGDKHRQLRNVRNIMAVYKDGSLKITPYVTYWSQGFQLCQPRPFDWNEFSVINAAQESNAGFWVEGLVDMQNAHRGSKLVLEPPRAAPSIAPPRHHFYKIACRIPGLKWWVALDFMLDTGATMMDIYQSDLEVLKGNYGVEAPIMGEMQVKAGYGATHTFPVIHLEVCLLDARMERLTPWTCTSAMLVNEGKTPVTQPSLVRADGPLFRHLLHHVWVPNNKHEVIISQMQAGMYLPKAENSQHRGIANRYNKTSLEARDYGDDLKEPSKALVDINPWPVNGEGENGGL